MRLFRWIKGRHSETDYEKFCFLYFRIGKFGFDGYILKYEPKTSLPIHKDPINGKHYRLNIKISGKCKFWTTSYKFRRGERIILFRPDLFPHSLEVLTKTYKLSFGFAKFNN